MLLNQRSISCQFTLLDFHIILRSVSLPPRWKPTLRCLRGKFSKSQSRPEYWVRDLLPVMPYLVSNRICFENTFKYCRYHPTKHLWPVRKFAYIFAYFRKIIWFLVRFKTYHLSISLKFQKVSSTQFQLKVTSISIIMQEQSSDSLRNGCSLVKLYFFHKKLNWLNIFRNRLFLLATVWT